MPKNTGLKVDFSEFKKLLDKLREMVAEKKNEREEWSLKITRIDNGYTLVGNENIFNGMDIVIEDSETDELKSHEDLLWEVMEYFNFGGTKHDPERLRVVREKRK